MEVRDTLISIFAKLEFDLDQIDDGTRLKEDLEIDSTELAEIAVAIESAFLVQVDDSELRGLATFGDVVAYVATARNAS
ncbi:MAG: acyl carrier protein [Nocardiopsaceae bacterium]|jgi:acyl carrier protein|nr:acyl carrier protein [Nocardiopsaceae bacterium]